MVTAMILSALGVARQIIQDEYLLSREAGMPVYPESLAPVLDELDRIGCPGRTIAADGSLARGSHKGAMPACLLRLHG